MDPKFPVYAAGTTGTYFIFFIEALTVFVADYFRCQQGHPALLPVSLRTEIQVSVQPEAASALRVR